MNCDIKIRSQEILNPENQWPFPQIGLITHLICKRYNYHSITKIIKQAMSIFIISLCTSSNSLPESGFRRSDSREMAYQSYG